MKEEDKISKEIGDKLRGYREEPPAGMFERIEQTLVEQGVVAPAREQSPKVVPLWSRPWVRATVASLAAACAAVMVLVGLRQSAPEEIYVAQDVTEESLEQPAVGEEIVAKVEQEEPAEDMEPVRIVATTMAEKISAPVVAQVTMESVVPAPVAVPYDELSQQQSVESSEGGENEPKEGKKVSVKRQRKRSATRKSDAELEEYWRNVMGLADAQNQERLPVELGLYAANAGLNRGNVRMDNVANNPMILTEQSELSTGGGHYMAPSLVPPMDKTNLEHFMPVTVGITVSYPLEDWLWLDSGLLYTNIYSTSDANFTSSYARRRTMDYLGVPLALSAHFANFDRLSLYGRVGGTVELCINAKDKYYLDGVLAEKQSLQLRPLTFSIDAAVGATLSIWDGLGLFAEVGCSYWMAPGGYPENYRTVHPLSLATRAGIRFAFN